jgi:hypothetical protein
MVLAAIVEALVIVRLWLIMEYLFVNPCRSSFVRNQISMTSASRIAEMTYDIQKSRNYVVFDA